MKLTPEEKKIFKNFKPGIISKDGFLGDDIRHVHDIVQADAYRLAELGVNQERLADRMQYFVDIGKEGLEEPVHLGEYIVQVRWDRGKIPCPFQHVGVYPLIHITVENTRFGKSLIYTQLSVHLIKQHGFLGGIGSAFRIDPEDVVEILGLSGD